MFKVRSFRPPDRHPDRLACNWMLVSATLAIAFHTQHLPVWLSGLTACFLLWRYFIENHAWRVPGRLVRWSLLLITAVVVFRHYGTLFGRDAGVAYLALLMALKILEIRSLRDYLLAVFLIYLLVLGALLFSQTLLTGLFAALVVMVTTHALVLLNRPHPLAQAQTLRLVWTLALQALPILLVLYLLFPRIQGSLWGLPQDAFGGRTGMSEQVSPGSINQLYNDDTIAFRTEFPARRPTPSQLYWRVFVLSDTDGRSWQRHRGPGDGRKNWRYEALSPAIPYTVFLQPHNQRWIPTLDLPVPSPNSTRLITGYALEALGPVHGLHRYDLRSHLRYITAPPTREELAHNTFWPGPTSPRVRQLLDKWQTHTTAPMQRVRQVLAYFNQQPFRYTLSPPLLTGDPLEQFLFESQAGYCEHYASAFVSLMRLSNIPARLVVGYQGGEWNDSGNYLIVRQSDAHAWAEVWLRQEGWVRVDPTAAVAPERIELGANALRQLTAEGVGIGSLSVDAAARLITLSWVRKLVRDLSWRWDAINNGWNRWVMAYGPKAQLQFLKLVGIKTPTWLNLVTTMVVAMVFLLLLVSAFWMHTRRKPDPVRKLYEKFCNKLKKIGFERSPTEGPLDYAQRLAHARSDLRDPIMGITASYIELRYSRLSAAGLARFRKQVSSFRATKRCRVSNGG